jgi:hypothetical protein
MGGRYRKNDPLTSAEAAAGVDIEGLLLLIWRTMFFMAGRSSTWDEMKRELSYVKPDSISNRFVTLIERGYCYRIELDSLGNEIAIIVGDAVHRATSIRYKTRPALYSHGRQLINYWKAPDKDVIWTPPPKKKPQTGRLFT